MSHVDGWERAFQLEGAACAKALGWGVPGMFGAFGRTPVCLEKSKQRVRNRNEVRARLGLGTS